MNPAMNYFKQFYYAIFKPHKYNQFLSFGMPRAILFSLLLSIMATLCPLIPDGISIASHNGITGIVQEVLPDYSYQDGQLTLDFTYNGSFDPVEAQTKLASNSSSIYHIISRNMDELCVTIFYYIFNSARMQTLPSFSMSRSNKLYVFINTDITSVADIDFSDCKLDSTKSALFITATDYCCYTQDSALTAESLQEVRDSKKLSADSFADSVDSEHFSKGQLITTIRRHLPAVYIGLSVYFVLLLLFNCLSWFFAGVFYSLVAFIFSSFMHKNLDYRILYKISIYAQTVSVLLNALNLATHIVPNIPLMYGARLITILYLFVIIRFLPAVTYSYPKDSPARQEPNTED